MTHRHSAPPRSLSNTLFTAPHWGRRSAMRCSDEGCRRQRENPPPTNPAHPEWSQLLIDAVAKPGIVSTAYSRFWNYSVGNQLLAARGNACARKLDPGPIHTFIGWKELRTVCSQGRAGHYAVHAGEPQAKDEQDESVRSFPSLKIGDGACRTSKEWIIWHNSQRSNAPIKVTIFTYKPHWFLLSQTDGEDYVPTVVARVGGRSEHWTFWKVSRVAIHSHQWQLPWALP